MSIFSKSGARGKGMMIETLKGYLHQNERPKCGAPVNEIHRLAVRITKDKSILTFAEYKKYWIERHPGKDPRENAVRIKKSWKRYIARVVGIEAPESTPETLEDRYEEVPLTDGRGTHEDLGFVTQDPDTGIDVKQTYDSEFWGPNEALYYEETQIPMDPNEIPRWYIRRVLSGASDVHGDYAPEEYEEEWYEEEDFFNGFSDFKQEDGDSPFR